MNCGGTIGSHVIPSIIAPIARMWEYMWLFNSFLSHDYCTWRCTCTNCRPPLVNSPHNKCPIRWLYPANIIWWRGRYWFPVETRTTNSTRDPNNRCWQRPTCDSWARIHSFRMMRSTISQWSPQTLCHLQQIQICVAAPWDQMKFYWNSAFCLWMRHGDFKLYVRSQFAIIDVLMWTHS